MAVQIRLRAFCVNDPQIYGYQENGEDSILATIVSVLCHKEFSSYPSCIDPVERQICLELLVQVDLG